MKIKPLQTLTSRLKKPSNKREVNPIGADLSLVRVGGLEPSCLAALDPKSSASTNSAIPA